jgi:hypothetical protein
MDSMVDGGSISPSLAPRGMDVINDPINISTTVRMPGATYWENQNLNNPTASLPTSNIYNKKRYLGWDFEFNKDHENWNAPIPSSTITNRNAFPNTTGVTGGNKFNVDALNGHPDATWAGSLSASG